MNLATPWQQRTFQRVLGVLHGGRLAHGLLICGPEMLGKQALMRVLIARLLCTETQGAQPACGRCRSCHLLAAGTHPDYHDVTLLPNEKGVLKKEIGVDQIREISQILGFTAQIGSTIVAAVHPADALNHAAANALLKTLEEPQDGRYLVLLTSKPHRLPATVRSRCQRIDLKLPERDEARQWLQQQHGAGADVLRALQLAEGHPGRADDMLRHGGLVLFDSVGKDLRGLARGQLALSEVCKHWLDERLADRLRMAVIWVRQLAVEKIGAGKRPHTTFDAHYLWAQQANLVRQQLDTPLRSDLLLADLLHQWAELGLRSGS